MQYSGRTIQIRRLHEGPCTCRTQDGLYKLRGFMTGLANAILRKAIQTPKFHERLYKCRTQEGLYKLGSFSGIMAWHEETSGLGMDALVTVCSWNTNGIMLWAWMLW